MRYLLLGLWFVGLGLFPGYSVAETSTEYKVKAAFLYHFVQFTEWPKDVFSQNDTKILICEYGDNSFDGLLVRSFDGKSVDGRRFLVRHDVSTTELKDCHLVFVNRNVDITENKVQQVLKQSRALMIGEAKDFLEHGGMIQFYHAGKKIRFAINPEALERKDIHLSSKLLQLAKIVKSK